MNIVTRKLIAKEMYVNRWFVIGGSVAGLLSVLITSAGRIGFNVGALMFITTIIAHGVMLAIYGVMNERKEHSLLFVLSLPLSIADYVRAKTIGLLLCFFIPWVVASAAAVALVVMKAGIPDGLVPFTVLLCVFMLANFSLVLCGTLHATTEAVVTAMIVITNMAVSLFMFVVGGLPSLQKHITGDVPVWNDTFWVVLVLELFTLAVALTLPFILAARRRDFI
jgi:ABC-2 type transport system permease protein